MRTTFAVALGLLGGALALAQYGDISDLKLLKPEDKVDMKSEPPPAGAIVLFDGKSLNGWVKARGKPEPATWELKDGVMQVKGGDIMTEKKFDGSFKLHVEFRVPYMPKASGQGRGNSGVYVQGRYEVQVLDSYGLKSQNNDCGGIYGVAAPLVNACKAPTIWQSYDIEYHSPVCKDGKAVEPARMTVFHNGVKIHDNVKLAKKSGDKEEIVANTTAGLGGDLCMPGPIMLQDHGNPVQFRNIWLVPMK
jgi:3-keto-disaccharide hydrolase